MKAEEIGKGIAQRRKQMGLTQEQLGARVGVSRQAVSKWESGTAMPSVDNFVELAQILETSVDELMLLTPQERPVGLSAESVGRLLDEQSKRQEKQNRRWRVWLIVMAAFLSIAVLLSALASIRRIRGLEASMQARLTQSDAALSQRIDQLNGKLYESMAQAMTLPKARLSDCGYRAAVYDHAHGTVNLQVYAYPISMSSEEEASFFALLGDGSRCEAAAQRVEGGFEGTLALPASPDAPTLPMKVYVSWHEAGEMLTECILEEQMWLDGLRLRIERFYADYAVGETLELHPHVEMVCPSSAGAISIRFEALVNGAAEAAWEESVQLESEGMTYSEYGSSAQAYRVAREEVLTLPPDTDIKAVQVRVTITDEQDQVFTAQTGL